MSNYIETYDHLHVCHLTPEYHERTCNYWFTVTSHCTAHTAFTNRSALDLWMKERGLSLEFDIPDQGDMSCIIGSYRRVAHMNTKEFYSLTGLWTKTLSNGDYTEAIITDDPDGIKTVHYLNPNAERVVYDYQETRQVYS